MRDPGRVTSPSEADGISSVQSTDPSAPQHLFTRAVNLIFGRPLATQEQEETKIGPLAGIPAMGLDALTSSAYGPEAALTILLPLGAAGLACIVPITLVILALLAILYFSYRQTIRAYPVNGGSYTVARENLGAWPGLLAAAALMIDYMLNVAVGISAGVAALVSAAPSLHAYTVVLCLGILLVITMLNLRGTGEAGLVFAVPTYLFIASLAAVLILGISRSLFAGGHPEPMIAPPAVPAAVEGVGLWILLRAFASGCTAMTGVEAVSNGVSAFRAPTVRNAHRTLTMIVVVLALLLGGVAYLAHAYHVGAMPQDQRGYQSILSQLIGAVVGRGWFYYFAIGSVLSTLCLSANSSFVGFPRLCRMIAQHDFLPRAFTVAGRRLVYSSGILFLAGGAALLLLAFRGLTDRLIPLFAVGAFLAFTLSQAGMVIHWRKQLRTTGDHSATRASRVHLWVNGVGAVATGVALAIILAAKFIEGAWITVLAVPLLLAVFKLINRHYVKLARQTEARQPLDLTHNQPPVVLVPTKGWDRLTGKALRFAMWLSTDVVAVHLGNLSGEEAAEEEQRVRREWAQDVEAPAKHHGVPPPQLSIVQTPYRSFRRPLLKEIDRLKIKYPGRLIAVVIPEVIETRWWHLFLHRRRPARLRSALLKRGDHRVVVINVPWYLEEPSEAALAGGGR
jgi:amino acid transporter